MKKRILKVVLATLLVAITIINVKGYNSTSEKLVIMDKLEKVDNKSNTVALTSKATPFIVVAGAWMVIQGYYHAGNNAVETQMACRPSKKIAMAQKENIEMNKLN